MVFVLFFVLLGPRILRTLRFDLHIVGAGLGWLWRWIFRVPPPVSLKESLLELASGHLEKLGARLASDEEFYGSLTGWKRSRGGPRRVMLLLTSRGLMWIEPRLFRKTRIQTMNYGDVSVARYRNLILLSRVEVLTRRNESVTLTLGKGNARYGEMAVHLISELAGLSKEPERLVPQTGAKLAFPPR